MVLRGAQLRERRGPGERGTGLPLGPGDTKGEESPAARARPPAGWPAAAGEGMEGEGCLPLPQALRGSDGGCV